MFDGEVSARKVSGACQALFPPSSPHCLPPHLTFPAPSSDVEDGGVFDFSSISPSLPSSVPPLPSTFLTLTFSSLLSTCYFSLHLVSSLLHFPPLCSSLSLLSFSLSFPLFPSFVLRFCRHKGNKILRLTPPSVSRAKAP